MPNERNRHVTSETREADRNATQQGASAGRMPTPDEERAAEKNDVNPDVARNEAEFNKMGANLEGEGRIEQ